MARPKWVLVGGSARSRQMTTTEVGRHLGMHRSTLIRWIKHGALPQPSFIDSNGVQYFDQEWVTKARGIVVLTCKG